MSDKRRIVANKLYNKNVLGGIEDEWINKERDIMRGNWYDYEQEIKQIVVKPTQVWNVENWLKEVEDQMK